MANLCGEGGGEAPPASLLRRVSLEVETTTSGGEATSTLVTSGIHGCSPSALGRVGGEVTVDGRLAVVALWLL